MGEGEERPAEQRPPVLRKHRRRHASKPDTPPPPGGVLVMGLVIAEFAARAVGISLVLAELES